MMKHKDERPIADSRKCLRSPLIIQKVHIEGERTVFFGYTKNISRSGMFIATTNPIEPGEQLNLKIPLPAPLKDVICCRCEVVWKRPFGKHLPFEPGLGIKFLDMPEEMAERIDNWIKSQP